MEYLSNMQKAIDEILRHKNDNIIVYTHIDTDGLNSRVVLEETLSRQGIFPEYRFLRQIDYGTIGDIPFGDYDLVIFADLGSGQIDMIDAQIKSMNIKPPKIVIFDHHMCQFKKMPEYITNVNPSQDGLNGSIELCGAGVCYLFARKLNDNNKDLSKYALLGAIGDVQNLNGKLEGLNRKIILKDALDLNLVSNSPDLQFYGKHTRPLFTSIKYFTDVRTDLTDNDSRIINFINHVNKKYDSEITNTNYMYKLTESQKRAVGSEFFKKCVRYVPKEWIQYLPKVIFGESYELLNHEPGTSFRSLEEYSTCINACSRYNEYEVPLEILKGNMNYESKMNKMLKKHKRNLAKSMDTIKNDIEVVQKDKFQYFEVSNNEIKGNIVGIIAGMSYSIEKVDWKKPIFAISELDEGYKISARCPKLLSFAEDINLAKAINYASEKVGGTGGGHKFACGAYIPDKKDFVKYLVEKV
ncbi:single-stranded-DNA-specific exonuclease RecJ [Methanococcus voltae]|uniref:RecJ-like exonuclease n=1 Tax=Methanococcus voltae PS TaxID=523842 RepID=A0ABT2ETX1_METVO|nr:single-stranded-DNA-specific exonuclease RecJ [Methanococcus voltae]MBP2172358.1 RecJ-like exonuclease [Methanococcus voltae]MCS3921411.1 RecJ-like exonuclease [Methanococcus voltae PS]